MAAEAYVKLMLLLKHSNSKLLLFFFFEAIRNLDLHYEIGKDFSISCCKLSNQAFH